MRQNFDESTDPSYGRRHLPLIREQMRRMGLDGFLIPHEDEHQNEYLPEANDRLAWATGFTGSAGAAAVTGDRAAIFVDGRYTLQVRSQVDTGLFEVRDLVEGGVPAWLEETARPGQTIGYDPKLHSPDALQRLRAAADKAGAALQPVQDSPVDLAWGEARPAQPMAPVVPHPLQFSGEESAAKRAQVGKELGLAGADAAVLTAPASLAWLFNVRGGDVIRSPLPIGQAILRADGTARVFLDPAKVSEELPAWLGNQVTLESPDAIASALADLRGAPVLVDPAQSSAWWFEQLEANGARVVRGADPCALPRACKNAVEIEGSRRAHVRDGAAVCRFLHWLATEAQTTFPDEIEVAGKLEGFREATGALKDLSFDSIVGAGPNGAIVHYRATHKTNRKTGSGELLLVDSGAQYLEGTTDITRTVAMGEPTDEMRERFTLVLKGHIALSSARFPPGTTGHALDALARAPLWRRGFDSITAPGHGVGSYLGVHEGPQRIAKAPNSVPLRPGMIVSNEPGYYKTGAYGIRIENLLVVTPAEDLGGERPMHGFETLTLAPIDRRADSGGPAGRLRAGLARRLTMRASLRPWRRAWSRRSPLWLEAVCAPL
jgi:Xaa-Pro aminopeptidase